MGWFGGWLGVGMGGRERGKWEREFEGLERS